MLTITNTVYTFNIIILEVTVSYSTNPTNIDPNYLQTKCNA